MKDKCLLGIVIVAYKSAQLTIDFVKKELPKVDVPWVCCIVNNVATQEETCKMAEGVGAEIIKTETLATDPPKSKGIYIVPLADNVGFARGNNWGVKFLLHNFDCSHLLFANNDVEILSSNCLSVLIDKLNDNPEIGAIGPRIFCLDGGEQLPHDGYVSVYRQIGWHLLPFLRKNKPIPVAQKDSTPRPSGYTYWVQGAFMVMRTDDFLRAGMFDPATFLYAEEPILAERLKAFGKRMYYENSVSILHYEGGTIVKQHGNRKSEYMVMESNCYYYRKYLHYNPLLVWLYRTTFRLTH